MRVSSVVRYSLVTLTKQRTQTKFGDRSMAARQQIPLIGSQEAENLIVEAETLCLAVRKLLSDSKELRRLVGSETWN